MGLAIDTFVDLSSRAKSDYEVAGVDIVATEKAIGPAIVQISNEEDDVALRSELPSTHPRTSLMRVFLCDLEVFQIGCFIFAGDKLFY